MCVIDIYVMVRTSVFILMTPSLSKISDGNPLIRQIKMLRCAHCNINLIQPGRVNHPIPLVVFES